MTIGANAKINANITLAGGTIALADGVTSATVYGKITDGCFADGLVTVTYNIKGTDYATQILRSGSAATKPTDPTNSVGAAFLGWYRDDGTEHDFTQTVTENITLTAKFAAFTKTVTNWSELQDALANDDVDVVQLAANGISPWGNVARTLYVGRAVTLDLNGYVLKGDGCSVFEIENGGHLTVIDSNPTAEHKFWVNNNYSYGVWQWNSNGSGDKTAYGGVINGGYTSNGGGVKLLEGGKLTMNGGSIVGCGSSDDGGGVYVCGGGEFEMNAGAAIIGCASHSSIGSGGGVYVNCTFIMNGGTIRECVARGDGGGVASTGQFTMNGGTIENCAAPYKSGGAVYHRSRATLTLNGTITSDNSSVGQPVYVQSGAVVTVIIGAGADIQTNMYLSNCSVHANGGTVRGDLFANWDIWFSVDEGVTQGTIFYGKLTGNCDYNIDGVTASYKVNGEDYATQFLRSGSAATKPAAPTVPTGKDFDCWLKADGTRWDFTTAVTENATLMGWLYVPVTNDTELRATLADDTVDVIRLTGDIDISASLTILRKVTLDLNGHVLKMTGSGSVIILDDNNGTTTGDLTLIDSDPTAEHKFKVNGVEPWVLDDSGTEIVKGGVITGGTGTVIFYSGVTSTEGGGVIIGGGALTMNGGNIVGCIARYGGGLYLRQGSFTMNGGSIVGCSSTYRSSTTGEPYESGIYGYSYDRSKPSVITLIGGLIKNIGQYGINTRACTIIYANGGEVYGEFNVGQTSKVTSLPGHTGVTVFKGRTVIDGASGANVSHIDWGIYYGELYFDDGGKDITIGLIVTYMIDDVEYAKQVLPSGTLATRPDDPTKQGYIFEDWYTSDGAKWNYATDTVTENVTLTAKWNIKTAEVKTAKELENALADDSVGQIRLVADITLDGNTEIKVTEGRKVILDLNGYVLNLAGKYISVSATSMGEGGTNIYPNQLTIIDSNPNAPHKFTPNADGLWVLDETGGTETVLGGVITGGNGGSGGAMVVGLSGTVIMNGGNIVGCSADGSGGAVNVTGDGTFIMNDGNIVGCKATWSGGAVCVRSTFIMNGGTMNADGGTVGGTVLLEAASVINGGGTTFSGLIINNNAQAEFDGVHSPLGIVGEKPTGVNGHKYCTVTFDPAGGTMEYTTRYFLQEQNISDEIKPDPRTGYTFDGWYKADGTAWDYASDKVTGDITLYAKWTAKTYTVTFDTAGGLDIATKTMTATYGKSLANMPVPRREGYVFLGWYDAMVGGKVLR